MSKVLKSFNDHESVEMEIGQCPIGLTVFHREFTKGTGKDLVMKIIRHEGVSSRIFWYELQWKDDITGRMNVAPNYKVLVVQKAVKAKAKTLCEVCNKTDNHVWLDVHDDKNKCASCMEQAGESRPHNVSARRLGGKSAGKLVRVYGAKGAPSKYVERSTLMVTFDKYLSFNKQEQYAALSCIVNPDVLRQILDYETTKHHKGKANRALRLIRKYGR
jgi:hypothetical protein